MYIDHPEMPSKGYFAGIGIMVMVGCWNAGFVLAGNGIATTLGAHMKWDGDNWKESDHKNTILQTVAVLGLTLGSMFSKPILQMGRRWSMLLANLIIAIVTIPVFFMDNFVVLNIIRFIFGFCSAVLINSGSNVIGEAVPSEYQATVGCAINTGICSGIFFTNCFNLLLPYS